MIDALIPFALAATLAGPSHGSVSDTVVVGPRTTGEEYSGRDGALSVPTPVVEDAGIRIDGRADEEAWSTAAVLTSFTQYEPVEGQPAAQPTEVMVLVDRSAIYFAIRAFDDVPDGIRATLGERDSFTRSDDYVRVVLDTFNDQRRAYVFSVNPMGVQHDGIWNEGGSAGRRGGFGPPVDDNPDFLWESDAQIADWGYLVEIKVPFKSLRFPEVEAQDWGIQVTRRVQRNGFESAWAPLTENIPNRLTQSGRLTGLLDLDPGMFLEINPVLTGNRFGALDEDDRFVHGSADGDFGLNMTYGVTSNLTLDATYNPDFSQVEADAGQISVNERFALFFPEKRPFFLEGTEVFGMPRQLVYTRSIANPIGGAKLTGKVGSLNVGYIGAVDESFDAGDPDTYVNLFRVKKDVGQSGSLGAVYTDRTVAADHYNRVLGGDARLVLGRRYTVTLMGAGSFSEDPDLGTAESGRMLYSRVERAGRTFSFNSEFEDSNEAFDAGSGFFNRVGDTQLQSRVSYNWFGTPGAFIEQFSPSFEVKGFWDHDDFWDGRGVEEAEAQIGWRVSLRDNITLFGNHQRRLFSFDPEAYDGLLVPDGSGDYQPFRPDQDLFGNLASTNLSMWLSTWQRVRGNIRVTFADTPIFDRSRGVAVEPANSVNIDGSLNLYPTRALQAEVGVRHNTLTRESGAQYSTATIPRLRVQYQFSRAFFVRGIFEYSAQEREELRDPVTGRPLYTCEDGTCSMKDGSTSNDFHVEGLVTYEPSPGTVFYLGYTRQMQDSAAFDFRDVRPTADGLFVKLSYRFRF
ncbi:MAG: DUF5916 domain-containing protein [Longimicrobiales bacterium]